MPSQSWEDLLSQSELDSFRAGQPLPSTALDMDFEPKPVFSLNPLRDSPATDQALVQELTNLRESLAALDEIRRPCMGCGAMLAGKGEDRHCHVYKGVAEVFCASCWSHNELPRHKPEQLTGRDAQIWSDYCAGIKQKEIGQKFGISQQAVNKILNKTRN
jgi:hypothetical protein